MAPAAQPLSIPETMTRTDIGDYMRELREHFSLTQHDVSERLHIRVKYVVAMEQGLFDQLPGKVYARGYVHTYAEFLGLDADQVVERCFGEQLPREQILYVPVPASAVRRLIPRGWVALGGFMALALVMYTASDGVEESEETVATSAVETVPESLLASMRTLVMPTTKTNDCFRGAPLGCYFGQSLTHTYVVPAGAISRQVEPEVKPPPPVPVPKPIPKPAAKPAPVVEAVPEPVAEVLPENYTPSPSAVDEEAPAIDEPLTAEEANQLEEETQ